MWLGQIHVGKTLPLVTGNYKTSCNIASFTLEEKKTKQVSVFFFYIQLPRFLTSSNLCFLAWFLDHNILSCTHFKPDLHQIVKGLVPKIITVVVCLWGSETWKSGSKQVDYKWLWGKAAVQKVCFVIFMQGLDVKYGINFLNTCKKRGDFPFKMI